MNWLDLFIILFLIAAIIRGSEVGFVRQFCSTVGFFTGLFLGAWLNSLISPAANTPQGRALLAFLVLVSLALMFMALGEYVGTLIKVRLRDARITDKVDKVFGSMLAGVTLLAAVWLGAAIFRNVPDSGWQRQIRNSRVVALLDNKLPSAPEVLTRLGHLIAPNNFPQVFSGLEPELKTDAPLPDMGELNPAVQQVRASVVKIEGQSCNNIVEGSGFVAGSGLVVTNAHVVAGVRDPFVLDQNGRHDARVVLFDPELDIAILRTDGLAGKPLKFDNTLAPVGTSTAVLGYPSGSGFTAEPGVVLETFQAQGRNIYNQGLTIREVYSVKTNIEQGNSGGPLIDKDGEVIGVIFAKSVNHDSVGYALTAQQVSDKLAQARNLAERVSTRACTV
ncbi:MarP family serine protease [Candidatus Saccharibacteria bacterium]|nr:MarP family serine protease [Candidatus Saccharibacteria bacterium]